MNNPYVKTLEPVWQKLDDVFVNEEKLRELIGRMKRETLKTPAWAVPNVQPPIDCKPIEWINYICTINTVNFAFTNFEKPWKKFTVEFPEGRLWDGAFALGASFMRAHNEGIPIFEPKYLAKISLKDVRHIFRPIDKEHKIPMIRERWKIFHEVGKVLLEKYNGNWAKPFTDTSWRAFNAGHGIVEGLVRNFPSFRDERIYKGHHLQFNKRAQLLVMMYHGRAVNSGGRMPPVQDIENIGPIADYEVPKALRFLGVLEYHPKLEMAIKNHKIFKPGDPEEAETRLAMSYAMWRICQDLGINMAQADAYVWFMGRESNEPHMLVSTINY